MTMFYLHAIGSEPTTGTAYETKAAALANRADGQTVTRVISDDDRATWQTREEQRFSDGKYIRVPWHIELIGYYGAALEQSRAMLSHYAHLSIDHPGMIAYTPDDAHGVEDRQLRTKPGRYLAKYAADVFTAEQIAAFDCTARAAMGTLKIARTADDIARVYCAPDSPGSCMDGDHFDFADNPVRVYGDSDLAIAYIGDISTTSRRADHIAARCIVWESKKQYGRAYGDCGTMQTLLQLHGYTHKYDFDGAKVRAMRNSGGAWIMPYVDGADNARLSSCGKWFILGDGEYQTKRTDGTCEEVDMCSHCGDEPQYDGGPYCEGCCDNVSYCEVCNEDYFGEYNYFDARGIGVCDSCAGDARRTCEHCNTRYSLYDYGRYEAHEELCPDCNENGVRQCEDCSEYCDAIDDDDRCDDCAKEARKIASQPKPRPRGTVLRVHRAGVAYDAPLYGFTVMLTDGSSRVVSVIAEFGHLLVHRDATLPGAWTVTHRLTGLRAGAVHASRDNAIACARRLSAAARADWSFASREQMSDETRDTARAIVAEYVR